MGHKCQKTEMQKPEQKAKALLSLKNEDIKEKKNSVGSFGNNPIYPLLPTWISTWTEPEALNE